LLHIQNKHSTHNIFQNPEAKPRTRKIHENFDGKKQKIEGKYTKTLKNSPWGYFKVLWDVLGKFLVFCDI
jgi:hypothetical protein